MSIGSTPPPPPPDHRLLDSFIRVAQSESLTWSGTSGNLGHMLDVSGAVAHLYVAGDGASWSLGSHGSLVVLLMSEDTADVIANCSLAGRPATTVTYNSDTYAFRIVADGGTAIVEAYVV